MYSFVTQLYARLTKPERLAALGAVLAVVLSGALLAALWALRSSTLVPDYGGTYREALVGQPVFINPIIAQTDADRDIVGLVYSNLYDLAESVTPADHKLSWTIRLREGLAWHDGEPLTADDVLFTIEKIQDPDARSPLSPSWRGVIAERVSEREIKLTTGAPYAFFTDNVRQLFVVPKHLFEGVPLANWRLSDVNLKPVGSGPFEFKEIVQERNGFISSYVLRKNETYFGVQPYLKEVRILFFGDETEAIQAFNAGRVDGVGNIPSLRLGDIGRLHTTYDLHLPNYYALFLNQSTSNFLKNKNVRLALNFATPKERLVRDLFAGHAAVSHGPVPYATIQTADQEFIGRFDPERATSILDEAGVEADEAGTRGALKIIVPDLPFLVETASIVATEWGNIGVSTTVIALPPSLISSDVIKTRNYEVLLFGNALSRNPDLLSFWHSSERFYPGLNLSLYNNSAADTLMETVRREFDPKTRAGLLASLQSLIIQDMPAVFLYSPNYLYVLSTKVGGVELLTVPHPAERFANIESWYIKTRRVWSTKQKEKESEQTDEEQSEETATTTEAEEI